MTSRRDLLSLGLASAALLAALPGAARAAAAAATASTQASSGPFRILMITFRGETDAERGFRDYFASAGIPVEFLARDVKQNIANLAAILEEIPSLKPDLIYTWGTPVTLGVVGPFDAPASTPFVRDIPVVFSLVAAPVQSRIARSLASSGHNVTGAVHVVPTDVQLRAMQSYLPFKKIGVLYSPAEQNSIAIVDQVKDFCARQNSTLVARTFNLNAQGRPTADGVEAIIADIKSQGADWLYLLPDTFLGTVYDRVTPAALAQQLPTFGAAELAVRQGGALVGLISRYHSVGQLAAAKAVDILVHRKAPADIPIETLKRFSLLINMRTAKQLGGVYPPIDMLNYAEVISLGKEGAS